MALDGGLIKEGNGCSDSGFSLFRSVASGLEKPQLAA